jgi:hypothetical protein
MRIIAVGLVMLVHALLFPNDTAIVSNLLGLSLHLVLVSTFFISTFAFAAIISSAYDELPLRVREAGQRSLLMMLVAAVIMPETADAHFAADTHNAMDKERHLYSNGIWKWGCGILWIEK